MTEMNTNNTGVDKSPPNKPTKMNTSNTGVDKSPPKKPTKKKQSRWRWYLFFILTAGGYIFYQYPEHIERYLNVEIPRPVKSSIRFIKTQVAKINLYFFSPAQKNSVESELAVSALEEKIDTDINTTAQLIDFDNEGASDTNNGDTTATAPATRPEALAQSTTQSTAAYFESQAQPNQLVDRLEQIERQYLSIANELKSLKQVQSLNNDTIYWRLKIIDLNFQLNGDSHVTANAIGHLISIAPRSFQLPLKAEQARVLTLPSRQTVLVHIQTLKHRLNAPVTAEKNNGASGGSWYTNKLKQLFNYKQHGAAPIVALDDKTLYAMLDKLEYLLLSRQDDAYAQQLQILKKQTGVQKIDLQQLIEYGAVSYQLNNSINKY